MVHSFDSWKPTLKCRLYNITCLWKVLIILYRIKGEVVYLSIELDVKNAFPLAMQSYTFTQGFPYNDLILLTPQKTPHKVIWLYSPKGHWEVLRVCMESQRACLLAMLHFWKAIDIHHSKWPRSVMNITPISVYKIIDLTYK